MTPATQTIHRSDAEVFAAARRALDCNPRVPAAVRVHVDRGFVTLTGSVRAMSERDAAEETVRGVEGVHGVANDIFVVNIPAAGFEPPDESKS